MECIMQQINKVMLEASLTRPPSIHVTARGTTIINGTVAMTSAEHGYEQIQYLPVRFIGKTADMIKNQLKPGVGLLLDGTLEETKWMDKSRQPRNKLTIHVQRVQALAEGTYSVGVDVRGGLRMKGGKNQVIAAGNMTADTQMQTLPSGDLYAEITIALNETLYNRDNQPVKNTTFIRVLAYRDLAQKLSTLKKGQPLKVEGTVRSEKWVKDGEIQSTLKIDATDITVLARPTR